MTSSTNTQRLSQFHEWGFPLLEARLADDVEAERAVFIAQSDDGEFPVDGVFNLDHLILRGGDVRDVGNHQIARDLLLDRNAGNRILLRVQNRNRWPDAEMADSEQAGGPAFDRF